MASLPNIASEMIFSKDIMKKKFWINAKINFEGEKTVSKQCWVLMAFPFFG